MIKIELEALDGKPITPRTGKAKVLAQMTHFPIEGNVQVFVYDNEDCESPGVRMATDDIERLGRNEFKFYDDAKRPFKIKIIELDNLNN